MKRQARILLFISILFCKNTFAQFDQNKTLHKIYNFEFEDIEQQLDLSIQKNPTITPSTYLLKSFLLRWKYIPIYQNTNQGADFEKLLEKVIEESEKNLAKNPKSNTDLYHIISAGLFLSEYHASKENYVKAIYFGNKLYPHLLTTFEFQKTPPEFLFIQGLYLYYIEKFKEKSFFYKSMLWGFKSGDKGMGIELLKQSASIQSPSQTEAIMFLAHVNLRHENNPKESLSYARTLASIYPNNIKYRELLVESLIANKLWDEAQSYNKLILNQTEPYFRLGGEVFEALITEKTHQNLEKAKKLYEKAINFNQLQIKPNLHFQSICFLGLSRIANREKEHDLAEEYFDKAKEIAPYDYIFDNHF